MLYSKVTIRPMSRLVLQVIKLKYIFNCIFLNFFHILEVEHSDDNEAVIASRYFGRNDIANPSSENAINWKGRNDTPKSRKRAHAGYLRYQTEFKENMPALKKRKIFK